MRGGWALIAGVAFCSVAFATPAAACVYLPIICIGEDGRACEEESAEQRLARARRESTDETRRLAIEARTRIRSGNVDFATELSELLVPNVRPVWAIETSCGLMGEIDYGEDRETTQSLFDKVVAGTPLAGSDRDQFARLFREADLAFGERCNAEFRRGFAAYLRRAVEPEDLQQAWRFLSVRKRTRATYGSIYPRLMSFEGRARTPPVRWNLADYWLNDQARRYVRREPAGQAILAAVNAFWAERGAQLDRDGLVCPEFSARWEAERERLVAQMTAQAERRRQARVRTGQP